MARVVAVDGARERIAAMVAARLAENQRKADPVTMFWDYVNTSPGPYACHPWTGPTTNNHSTRVDATSYDYAAFDGLHAEYGTRIAQRLVLALTYGRAVPRDRDVTPLCGDHTCCNERHLVVAPVGGSTEYKLTHGVPAKEFFCGSV